LIELKFSQCERYWTWNFSTHVIDCKNNFHKTISDIFVSCSLPIAVSDKIWMMLEKKGNVITKYWS